MPPVRIAHIVNPVAVSEASDLAAAQPLTWETMRIARDFARERVDVRLYAAYLLEDASAAPPDFAAAPPLERTVLDLAEFSVPRRLPLLQDICDRLYEADDEAEILIYTDVDIALMPHFYAAVAALLDQGYDALSINRRTVARPAELDLPLLYSEIGDPHPGADCFVFRRTLYPQIRLGRVCVGAPRFGRLFILNFVCFAQRYAEIGDLHLTFHIGNERVWLQPRFEEYTRWNKSELDRVVFELDAAGLLPDHELVRRYAAHLLGRRARARAKLDRVRRRLTRGGSADGRSLG